jgi:ubiquitin-protein ligase
MDKQRILKEAQRIAAKFSFWMVSGNISHLYGYVLETPEIKYEAEIKFDENFPQTPPQFIFHDAIKELLGVFTLSKLNSWTPESAVVDLIHELKAKIQEGLSGPQVIEETDLVPIQVDEITHTQQFAKFAPEPESEGFLTPDLNAYPPDFDASQYNTQAPPDNFFYEGSQPSTPQEQPSTAPPPSQPTQEVPPPLSAEPDETSLAAAEELAMIQQYYPYDQRGSQRTDVNVYMTITITKTFIVQINFSNYPEKPIITFPSEVTEILGDPYHSLEKLRKWNVKKPPHIVDILFELDNKLRFIQDIETEAKKVLGEYQCDLVATSVTQLTVHLLTYGFKEYLLSIDLGPYPKPPKINLTPELQQIIQVPIDSLNSIKNWKEKESEPVEVVREIAWLVDKNSRINFELELLKEHYKDINYDPSSETLRIDMKGKMKTQDLTFQFQIKLPREYPMKMPEIQVLNEFELDSHEKTKNELQTSFKDFFNEWSPFSYLVDLFNLISEKIFAVSVVSCVICHKKIEIEQQKAAVECPHCERPYHENCWSQTMQSFGKCGFCLRTPPPSML